MTKTPEEILAAEAGDGTEATEISEFSTEDIAAAEDALSRSDANDAADAREERIEMDNDSIDTLVDDAQEFSDEGISNDGNQRD